MTLRPFLGLRGRLLAALVLTSAVTLAVASFALVGPLTERLRSQSTGTLRQASLDSRPRFERALQVKNETDRHQALQEAGLRLRGRANARVLVTGVIEPAFLYDTDIGAPVQQAQRVALRTLRLRRTVVEVDDDRASFGIRLFGARPGVLVTERRLTDVTTTVQQVRNALLAAGGVGLLVAILLSAALSSTLLRRLARLRAAALRITEEGPDAPEPRDDTRDEVGDLARALARMQEALRREEASRRSFVATASHELRTPLTMLQGTMELLEEDLRGDRIDLPDAQRQVSGARRELRRLANLAGELLDLSRLDAQVPLRSEPVELTEMVRAVAAELALQAQERGVEIDATPPREPCWAIGDPDAVARVVRILVDNALRHAPPGSGVRIRARTGARPAIEVVDRGPGVLPQDRERIFERFFRSAEAGAGSGFGLGLAIGRGLAERMGGTLELRGADGDGAHFVLELPAAGPALRAAALSAARSPA